MERQLNHQEVKQKLQQSKADLAKNRPSIIYILDQIEDNRNLAAFFRLSDAAGVQHIYLYQENPRLLENTKVQKISRNTSRIIPFTYLHQIEDLKSLKKEFLFVALEITTNSIPYYHFEGSQNLALVIGNEKRGIQQALLDLCETSLHIPMMGNNSSMNVAMATGIATYGLLEKMGGLPKG